jgi:hypothetical protein
LWDLGPLNEVIHYKCEHANGMWVDKGI